VPPWHAVQPAPDAEPVAAPSPLRAILLSAAGILLVVVLGVAVSARVGALTLAATLAVAGTWRALSPAGPPGLVVRSRGFDAVLCWSAAAVTAFLALTAPGLG
jgi:hypothetical protein